MLFGNTDHFEIPNRIPSTHMTWNAQRGGDCLIRKHF